MVFLSFQGPFFVAMFHLPHFFRNGMHAHTWAAVCACTALALWCAPIQAQDGAAVRHLRIVGGLAGISQYTNWEEPFWTRELPKLSRGRFSAEIVPFDRAGVPGDEMLSFLQRGVVPFGTVLLSALTATAPEYTAPDLAGLNPDMASLKISVAAFRPALEKKLRETHGVELLAMYVYPAQVVFCRKPLASLSDLSGRRVRVSSAGQADFVEALDAVPVHIAFARIVPGIESGSVDCAITGTMSGNTLGLHAVTTHLYAMPLTWGLALFGANKAAWDALPADLRSLLRQELPRLESAIWSESERDTAQGLACNSGASTCILGRKGRMQVVQPSVQDGLRRQEIFKSTVLPRWLQRCGRHCADLWNQTIGAARGLTLPKAP